MTEETKTSDGAPTGVSNSTQLLGVKQTAEITIVARFRVEVTAKNYAEAFDEVVRSIHCDHPGHKSTSYT